MFVCKDIFTIIVWALSCQLMNMPSPVIVWSKNEIWTNSLEYSKYEDEYP
jgi:hypothetical protein